MGCVGPFADLGLLNDIEDKMEPTITLTYDEFNALMKRANQIGAQGYRLRKVNFRTDITADEDELSRYIFDIDRGPEDAGDDPWP